MPYPVVRKSSAPRRRGSRPRPSGPRPGAGGSTRVRHARLGPPGGARTPIAATIPSSRRMGTAMVTEPETTSPSLRPTPVPDLVEVAAQLAPRPARRGEGWRRRATSSRISGGRVGEQDPRQGAGVERPGRARARRLTRRGWCDGTSCRHTADDPTRRAMTAVSPVSSASMSRTGIATRMSSSLVTMRATADDRAAARAGSPPRCGRRTRTRSASAGSGRSSRSGSPAGRSARRRGSRRGRRRSAARAGRARRTCPRRLPRAVGRGRWSLGCSWRAAQYEPPGYRIGSRRRYCAAMRITAIRLQRLSDPARPAVPGGLGSRARARAFAVTIVRVETDEGVVGIGSGDTMDGFEAYEHLFVGQDPLAIARHVRVLETHRLPCRAVLAARGRPVGHRRPGRRPAGGDPVRWRDATACRRTRRAGRCCRPRSAPSPRCGCARRGSGRSRSGSIPRRLDGWPRRRGRDPGRGR